MKLMRNHLTESEVLEIYELIAKGVESKMILKKYSILYNTLAQLKQGRIFKDLYKKYYKAPPKKNSALERFEQAKKALEEFELKHSDVIDQLNELRIKYTSAFNAHRAFERYYETKKTKTVKKVSK